MAEITFASVPMEVCFDKGIDELHTVPDQKTRLKKQDTRMSFTHCPPRVSTVMT